MQVIGLVLVSLVLAVLLAVLILRDVTAFWVASLPRRGNWRVKWLRAT